MKTQLLKKNIFRKQTPSLWEHPVTTNTHYNKLDNSEAHENTWHTAQEHDLTPHWLSAALATALCVGEIIGDNNWTKFLANYSPVDKLIWNVSVFNIASYSDNIL